MEKKTWTIIGIISLILLLGIIGLNFFTIYGGSTTKAECSAYILANTCNKGYVCDSCKIQSSGLYGANCGLPGSTTANGISSNFCGSQGVNQCAAKQCFNGNVWCYDSNNIRTYQNNLCAQNTPPRPCIDSGNSDYCGSVPTPEPTPQPTPTPQPNPQPSLFCGDTICNNGETTVSCATDCGNMPCVPKPNTICSNNMTWITNDGCGNTQILQCNTNQVCDVVGKCLDVQPPEETRCIKCSNNQITVNIYPGLIDCPVGEERNNDIRLKAGDACEERKEGTGFFQLMWNWIKDLFRVS